MKRCFLLSGIGQNHGRSALVRVERERFGNGRPGVAGPDVGTVAEREVSTVLADAVPTARAG